LILTAYLGEEKSILLNLTREKDCCPKATGLEVGMLINFGEHVEIKRKVFTPPSADGMSQEIGFPIS
jgi:hypothetical protein